MRSRARIGVRRWAAVPLALALTAAAVSIPESTPVAAATTFTDVAETDNFSDAVEWLVDQEITTGTSPTTYSPDLPLTRAQFATFLHRFAGEPDGPAPDFADVSPGTFFFDAVGWLADTGITTGTSPTTFSPNDPVTRSQLALFLHRYAGTPDPGDPGTNRTPGSYTPAGTTTGATTTSTTTAPTSSSSTSTTTAPTSSTTMPTTTSTTSSTTTTSTTTTSTTTTSTTTTTTSTVPPTTTSLPAGPVDGAYIESDGLVVIETTSLDVPSDWEQFPADADLTDKIVTGATGGSYIQWGGANCFGCPTTGLIEIDVEINNPGRYQILWHSAVGIGNAGSDHNDSFLTVNADKFYGELFDSIVCPNGAPDSNQCVGEPPEGASSKGFFKVYRFGDPDFFNWNTVTSDFNGHAVFAEFENVGTYTITVAARSTGHAIDRIVLFRTGNAADNVSQAAATDLAVAESATH